MGIFVGWIIQKRWMTAIAFVVTVIGAFTSELDGLLRIRPAELRSPPIRQGLKTTW